ncbi:MAG: tRNA (N6-isopentenyl adenosine(37)-C2)-methylthiotransferase MiaB [Hyphomicrobiaceae bacterium]
MSIPRAETTDSTAAKRVFLKTYGCQMNVYDSERIAEALALSGYSETDNLDDADLVLLNTCHIREKAAEKVYSELGRVRDVKAARAAAGKTTVVTVAGCVAQAEGAEMARRAPAVDIVIGPQSYHRLPDLIARAEQGGVSAIETTFPDEDKFTQLPGRGPARSPAAFLTVQEGCDKFCTFCVVPYTRGAEYSRPVADLESEARALAARGVQELTLLGQNVNAYHGVGPDGRIWSLAQLLRGLARIEGISRLRYTTSHPRDMTDDLIAAHADEPKMMPALHLPVQSGADRILAAMNRKHTAAEYLELVGRIRARCPDIALSTDLIVGFPGETDGEFEATLRLVEHVGFSQAYAFKYSARPGTPAATLGDQIPEATKTDRLVRLQDVLKHQQTSFNTKCVGRVLPVLFDRLGRLGTQLIGRSPYLQSVHVEAASSLLGRIMNVEIASAGPNSLAGVVKGA